MTTSTPPPPSALLTATQDILAGTAGGIMTVVVGHPLDTLKVRMQVSIEKFPTMSECIKMTWRENGIREFYKGAQSPLLGEGFFNAIQFLAYGRSQEFLLKYNSPQSHFISSRELTISEHFIAGALTGFATVFVECPIDLAKSQLQTQILLEKPRFRTLFGCFSTLYRINGLSGLYQGLGVTFLRTMPSTAAYFGTYQSTLKWLNLKNQTMRNNELGNLNVLAAGSLAGIMYWLTTYPMDSVKSAMQSDAIEKSQRKYKNFFDCWCQLWNEGGIKRVYRGLTPCLIRAMPANAACFLAYEKTLQWLRGIAKR